MRKKKINDGPDLDSFLLVDLLLAWPRLVVTYLLFLLFSLNGMDESNLPKQLL